MKNAVGALSSLKPNRNGDAMRTAASAKSSSRCTEIGSESISDVGPSVLAATAMTTTPATIDTATAAPDSKPNRNGAAISSAPTRYSIAPCRKREMGP